MCLIVLKPKGVENYLTFQRFKNALRNNPHSVGIVYRASDNRVKIERYIHPDKFMERIYETIADKDEYAIHFRYATHGEVDLYNCHPFIVTKDLCLMHNGIMYEFGKDHTKSDSRNFAENYLRPIVEAQGVEIIHDEAFKKNVEQVIGANNKLLLIDKDFNWSIFNEKAGAWKEGCWLSNTYSTLDIDYSHQSLLSSSQQTYDYANDYLNSYLDAYDASVATKTY